MPTKRRARGTGTLRQLPSGRWQAKITGYAAPTTFDTKLDADAWLRGQSADIARGIWAPPTAAPTAGTLAGFADIWLADHTTLKPRTRALYRSLLDRLILPTLGRHRLDRITRATVREWYASLGTETPTQRAHAYSLLRTIFGAAVAEELVTATPCRIPGAGNADSMHVARPATLPELEIIVAAMPARFRGMVLLAAWCGLRFGELAELRRGDIDLAEGLVSVTRAVVRVNGGHVVGDPKSKAGKRVVSMPPHLLPVIEAHLLQHIDAGEEALLFPAVTADKVTGQRWQHLAPATFYRHWYPAREAAGRPDLRFHDLRHTGATLAAATGATLAELMARLGHSTAQAAMRYQHAGRERDAAIAKALSGFASAGKVGLHR